MGAWGQVPPASQVLDPADSLEPPLCARHVLMLGYRHNPVPVEDDSKENITSTDGMWELGYKGTEQDGGDEASGGVGLVKGV